MEDAHICETELYAEQLLTSQSSEDATSGSTEIGGSKNIGENISDVGMKTVDDGILNENSGDEKDGSDSGQNKKAKKDDSSSVGIGEFTSNNFALETKMESDSGTVNASASVTTSLSPETSSTKIRKIHLPRHSLFAVFDGHGGTYAAQYSGQNFCRVLSRASSFTRYAEYVQKQIEIDSDPTSSLSPAQRAEMDRLGLESLETALRNSFIEIDREIYLTQSNPNVDTSTTASNNTSTNDNNGILPAREDEDSGTTAVVVILTPQWIVCANSGDSRAVYSKNQHQSIPLSYDHKPCDEAEEQRITEAGGFVRAGRVEGDLAVSRGFGDFRFKEAETVIAGTGLQPAETVSIGTRNRRDLNNIILPEHQKVSPVPDIIVQNRNREKDEFIILACDGIWDVQTNHECVALVEDIFREGESDLGLLCEEILDTCLDRGSKDNMTALVIKMPAQAIGDTGGGVMERRRLREAAIAEENS